MIVLFKQISQNYSFSHIQMKSLKLYSRVNFQKICSPPICVCNSLMRRSSPIKFYYSSTFSCLSLVISFYNLTLSYFYEAKLSFNSTSTLSALPCKFSRTSVDLSVSSFSKASFSTLAAESSSLLF